MSFGGIPAEMILKMASNNGAYIQQELPLDCPPMVFVDPAFLTQVPKKTKIYTSAGVPWSTTSTIDHPSFTATRDWLSNNGYIKMVTRWSNGDTVTKPFFFNNIYMHVGEIFACASAMAFKFSKHYNDGIPLKQPIYEKPEVFDNTEALQSWDDVEERYI